MKFFILAFFTALLAIICVNNFDFILESNRVLHFCVSASSVYFLRRSGATLNFTVTFVFLIGLCKEMVDPTFDGGDMFVNVLGILLGVFL